MGKALRGEGEAGSLKGKFACKYNRSSGIDADNMAAVSNVALTDKAFQAYQEDSL